MGAELPSDEAVAIRLGQSHGDPSVITINCADKIGLSCDFSRIILESGLNVSRADLSTDGKWCFLVFWVLYRPGSHRHVKWNVLKKNLMAACPPNPAHIFFMTYIEPKPSHIYILQVCSKDKTGLLHDISQVLWELEFTVHKVKASTTPDGRVVDLFFITDKRDTAHTKKRQDEICDRLKVVLGESHTQCILQEASSDYKTMEYAPMSFLPPSTVEDLFQSKLEAPNENSCASIDDDKVSVSIDNSLSPGHSLVQIACKDHRGLLYDSLRTLKDCNFQVSYGRYSTNQKGICEVDLFVLQADGRKIIDSQKQSALCFRLEQEISYPVRVIIVNRGPDTELLVASRIELSGRGRPRVLHDVTLVLKMLEICIFAADIGRYAIDDLQWEVYRFLLNDRPDFPLESSRTRGQITERVKNMLIG